MANDEVRNKAKARLTNELAVRRSFVTGHFCFVIHFSPFSKSWRRSDAVPFASIQSAHAWGLNSGTARAIIRRKCFVSRASCGRCRCFLETLSSILHHLLRHSLPQRLSLRRQLD